MAMYTAPDGVRQCQQKTTKGKKKKNSLYVIDLHKNQTHNTEKHFSFVLCQGIQSSLFTKEQKTSFDLILLPETAASHHRKCVKYVAHNGLTDTCKSSNGEVTDLILDTWGFK